jgi:hypothetical protein
VGSQNPVHPLQAAYKVMADTITGDTRNPEARYTNPPRYGGPPPVKHLRIDRSLQGGEWVSGFSVTIPRRGGERSGHGGRGHHPAGIAASATTPQPQCGGRICPGPPAVEWARTGVPMLTAEAADEASNRSFFSFSVNESIENSCD